MSRSAPLSIALSSSSVTVISAHVFPTNPLSTTKLPLVFPIPSEFIEVGDVIVAISSSPSSILTFGVISSAGAVPLFLTFIVNLRYAASTVSVVVAVLHSSWVQPEVVSDSVVVVVSDHVSWVVIVTVTLGGSPASVSILSSNPHSKVALSDVSVVILHATSFAPPIVDVIVAFGVTSISSNCTLKMGYAATSGWSAGDILGMFIPKYS